MRFALLNKSAHVVKLARVQNCDYLGQCFFPDPADFPIHYQFCVHKNYEKPKRFARALRFLENAEMLFGGIKRDPPRDSPNVASSLAFH